MNGKKGIAISLVIIICIILLVVMFFAYAIRSQMVEVIKPKTADASGVQIYVENCLDAVSQYAFYKIGKQGGSLELKPAYFSTPFLEVNYAYDSTKKFPALDTIKTEVEIFVNENLKNCTAGFGGFALKDVKITEGNVNSTVFFSAKSAIVTANYPLEVSSAERTYSLEKFQVEIPIMFSFVHSKTDNFVSGFEKGYDLTYIRTFNSNVYVTPFEDSDLFTIENKDSRIFNDPYLFLFAVR